jgi:hypothetical protein
MHERTELRTLTLSNPAAGQERSSLGLVFICLLLLGLSGCATGGGWIKAHPPRRFDFSRDTFAYPNELVWEYRYDDNGKWTTRRREVKPTYYQHCFVVSRSACQFFENAVFDTNQPPIDEATYRRLVRRVISTDPRARLSLDQKVVFPGFADLHSFSQAYEPLLKSECGGAWRCYVQRGNWRMIFPFSRHQQQQMVERIGRELRSKGVAVVHVVRFPRLSINHAMLIFGEKENAGSIEFETYDPNRPEAPVLITFDRATRTFSLPPNTYFPGGRVDVYPIYDRLIY